MKLFTTMKAEMTPEFVDRVHTAWVIFGLSLGPFLALLFRPHLLFVPMAVQSATFMIWGFAGAVRLCPLRALEAALRDGTAINPWWIIQPIATVVVFVIAFELFAYIIGWECDPFIFLWLKK